MSTRGFFTEFFLFYSGENCQKTWIHFYAPKETKKIIIEIFCHFIPSLTTSLSLLIFLFTSLIVYSPSTLDLFLASDPSFHFALKSLHWNILIILFQSLLTLFLSPYGFCLFCCSVDWNNYDGMIESSRFIWKLNWLLKLFLLVKLHWILDFFYDVFSQGFALSL